jgi:hypothetical protein
MSRYADLARRFKILRASLEQQATRLRLPFYTRFDTRIGATVPEDREAEQQAAELGLHLKEYIIDDDWSPDDEGIDE